MKFRAIEKFEGFDPEHFLLDYYFEIQFAKQEKQKSISHRWKNETKANNAENSTLYWTLKKTFSFVLNLFCFKLTFLHCIGKLGSDNQDQVLEMSLRL